MVSPVIASARLPESEDIREHEKSRVALARLVAAQEEGRPVYRIVQRELDSHIRAIIHCWSECQYPAAKQGLEELARLLMRCERDGTIDDARALYQEYLAFIGDWAGYFAESPRVIAEFREWIAREKGRITVN